MLGVKEVIEVINMISGGLRGQPDLREGSSICVS
jgi:hypothetical protein